MTPESNPADPLEVVVGGWGPASNGAGSRAADTSQVVARLDLSRSGRINMPEAVYCQAKTVEQCRAIVSAFLADGADAVIATRAGHDQAAALNELKPQATDGVDGAPYSTLTWRHRPSSGLHAAVVAAGTSDLAVAMEATLTLEAMGHHVSGYTDVGVAGLQRLTSVVPELADVDVVIAVAGMEGALPTVLAGLIPQPIVAVPTSAGYGTSFEGVTALVSMLASCAPGIAAVGIDNGYGAACAAHRILTSMTPEPDRGNGRSSQ